MYQFFSKASENIPTDRGHSAESNTVADQLTFCPSVAAFKLIQSGVE